MPDHRDKFHMKYVVKPDYYLDLGLVNISELLPLVVRLGDKFWEVEDRVKENKFEVLRHTQHAIFRFTPENADPRKSYSNPAWEIWKKYLLPIMDSVTTQYKHENTAYSKVMLARLRAGGRIDPHVDGRGSNLTTHKVHVPLRTNPKALFSIAGETRHLQVGRAYEVNNVVVHGVENLGETDRIHLIFEHYDAAASPLAVVQGARE